MSEQQAARQETGALIATSLQGIVAPQHVGSHGSSDMGELLGLLLQQTGEDYASDDPVVRARATNIFRTVMTGMGGEDQPKPSPTESFLKTALAPEEVRSSVAGIAQNIGGDMGRELRASYGIAESTDPRTIESPKYVDDDAMIAGTFVHLAMTKAEQSETSGKSVTPSSIARPEVQSQVMDMLATKPGVDVAAMAERMSTVYAEQLVPDMLAGYKAQAAERKQAAQELAGM